MPGAVDGELAVAAVGDHGARKPRSISWHGIPGRTMILITPPSPPLAVRIGTRSAIAVGFGLATAGFAALTFVNARWSFAAFVLPLIGIAAGLGLANGPASTESVAADEVGQASGISKMARYVGGSLAVAAAATVSLRSPNTSARPALPPPTPWPSVSPAQPSY